MGKSDTVLLALGAFLGVVDRKSRLVVDHCLCTVHNGIAQMGRPVLYHFAGAFRNAGLKISRFQSGKREQLRRTAEFGKIAKFSKDDRRRRYTDSRNGQHGRSKPKDTVIDLQLDFVPFPVSWTVKMKKKQKETQDILSYHTQAAGCSDKARAKASGGRQPIEECGRTGL